MMMVQVRFPSNPPPLNLINEQEIPLFFHGADIQCAGIDYAMNGVLQGTHLVMHVFRLIILEVAVL